MKSLEYLIEASAPRRPSRRVAVLIAVVFVVGCGVSERAAPLDVGLAREALKTSLECWKKGDSAAALKSSSPSIVAQDPDWVAGTRLVAYELENDGKTETANLFIPVKLTLTMKNGKQTTKTVTYVIGTSPHLMVFRSLH
jgi:hypothetical protein